MPFAPLVEPVAALSDAERVRTARHAVLRGFGELAQRRLAASRIAIVGAGGLGSSAVLALAAAGAGELVVIDDDDVEQSNLHRQVMHRLRDVGSPKADSAVRAAADLAPETVVRAVRERLTADNAAVLLAGAHVVIDGSDTFDTRAAVAAACEGAGTPLVWGAVQEFDAQATVFWSAPPAGTAPVVLADLYPPGTVGEVPTCAQVGVLGALCLQVGGVLAIEAIKLVTGVGEPLLGRVLLVDALRGRQREVRLRPAGVADAATPPAARPAGRPLRPADRHAEAAPTGPAAARQHAEPAPAARQHAELIAHVAPRDLAAARAAGAVVLDVREPHETARGTIEGATLLPLGALLADPAAAGPGPFVVVCQAGGRALRAAEALRDAGASASVLAGGMDAYARSGTIAEARGS